MSDLPHNRIDDVRIARLRPVLPPAILIEQLPLGPGRRGASSTASRREVSAILHGLDDRMLVVVGPCSIHDVDAARAYAERLAAAERRLSDALLLVMRVYFEKPRTRVGWKGLINDPHLDGSFRINEGLTLARGLLVGLAEQRVRAGCEFLDTITPQFLADTVSWGAIGARTTESQVHRELASGLSMPVGFKNGTDGNVKIAIDAVTASGHPHCFLSVTKQGLAAIVETKGNPDTHLILRGVEQRAELRRGVGRRRLCRAPRGRPAPPADGGLLSREQREGPSPADRRGRRSRKPPGGGRRRGVRGDAGEPPRRGSAGARAAEQLTFGQSITDACLGWEATEGVLHGLAEAVRTGRARAAGPRAAG